jgi:hypothetical protein
MIRNNVDTPLNSLKDSNVNPKVETMEEKTIKVCSLPHNTLRVRRAYQMMHSQVP